MNKSMAILLACCASATAQHRFPPIDLYNGDPTGAVCTAPLIQQSSTTGLIYTCQSGHMAIAASGSAGNPAGSANQMQFNGGSVFAASAATIDTSGNIANAGSLNSVLNAGTTLYPTLASAVSALPSTGGTITTPPNYTETLANLALGSSTKPVSLKLGQGSVITVTGTTGIQVFNESSISGVGTIKCAETGTVNSCVSNGQQDGTQEFFNLSGGGSGNLTIDCRFGSATVFTNGCVDLNGVFVPSALDEVNIFGAPNGIALHIHNENGINGGQNVASFRNIWINCVNNAGCKPLVIERSGAGTLSEQNFYGGAIEHAGLGLPEVTIDGHGTTFSLLGIGFFGTQVESNSANTTQVASFSISDAQGIGIYNMHFSGHPIGVPCIKLTQTVAGGLGPVVADNIRCSLDPTTHAIQDTVNGYTSPGGQLWDTYMEPKTAFGGNTTFTNPVGLSNASYAPAAIAGINLLPGAGYDQSFETGSGTLGTGWASGCTGDSGCVFLRDNSTAAPNGGTYSQKITVATSSGRDQINAHSAGWSIISGNLYLITFWAKNDGGTLKAQMHLADVTEGVDYCGSGAQNFVLTSTWQSFTYICKAVTSGSSVYLRLSNTIGTGTGSLWLDLVSFAPASLPAYPQMGILSASNPDGTSCAVTNNILSCSSPSTICTGTLALSTGAIAVGATTTNTATCTGALTTDNVMVDFSSTPIGVTGYDVTAGESLTIYKLISASDTLSVIQANSASNSGSITPGAMTVNYRVVR